MKAILYSEYGSPEVLRLSETQTPTPKDDELLVRVHAAGLNAADWHLMRGKPLVMRLMGFGLLRPKKQTFGLDFAGRVEAVGRTVTKFHPGDEVFGNGNGGLAEFVAVREDAVALKPANITFEQAAAVPIAAVTALQGMRDKGQIRAGSRVLITGASGGVGTFAVQIAKSFGANVTAVCSSRNVEAVRSLGADAVIDYTQANFANSGQQYDLILAVNGHHALSVYKRALAPGGKCVLIGGDSLGQLLGGKLLWPLVRGGPRTTLGNVMAKVTGGDLDFLGGLLNSGKVVPVVEESYPLNRVPDAMRYLEGGHARGKLVITLGSGSPG
jgi:NADPH:quinone reductase-like Zn-dependent oxidoreductase